MVAFSNDGLEARYDQLCAELAFLEWQLFTRYGIHQLSLALSGESHYLLCSTEVQSLLKRIDELDATLVEIEWILPDCEIGELGTDFDYF